MKRLSLFLAIPLLLAGCDLKQDVGDNGDAGCEVGRTSCGAACVDLQSDPRHGGTCGVACPADQVCAAGRCQAGCPQSLTNCSGACVNVGTDDQNCGACGNACPTGQHCGNLACFSCAQGTTWCLHETPNGIFGSCADLATDNTDCGACGHSCTINQRCTNGVCQ